jgi:hypothetical protein
MSLAADVQQFLETENKRSAAAVQRAALQLICGIDFDEAERAAPAKRAMLCRRVARCLEKERLKGARRHWSYDLNRHIALKQALDHLLTGDVSE